MMDCDTGMSGMARGALFSALLLLLGLRPASSQSSPTISQASP